MTCTITRQPDERFITLKFVGKLTRKFIFSHTLQAHKLGTQLDVHSYLVDMTEAQNIDTVLNNYQFVHEDMRNPEIDHFARVAVLVSPNDRSHDFAVLVSQNAANPVRIFHDRTLAKQFLLPN